jgi:hypothetical protein
MEPIEVTARFDPTGKITPLSFEREGVRYPIDSTGRRWNDGEGLHILVMAPGGKVYELVFVAAVGRWFLGKFPGQAKVA